jgi:hypothetical protein
MTKTPLPHGNVSGFPSTRIEGTNVVQLRGHIFLGNRFRSRKPREKMPFVLAGRIKSRDEIIIRL